MAGRMKAITRDTGTAIITPTMEGFGTTTTIEGAFLSLLET